MGGDEGGSDGRAVVRCPRTRWQTGVVLRTLPAMGYGSMRGALGSKGGEDASWASQTELKAPWLSARTRSRVKRNVGEWEERVYLGASVRSVAESDSADSMDWIARTMTGGWVVESGSS